MVILQDLIGKNVWDSYLKDSRRPKRKQSFKGFFCLIPIIIHHDSLYLFNGLVLFGNISRNKML